ncbi:MAG: phosphodiester glycosidase family protein, partial [Bacteroidetes bacterium]|nr:phosphodiester glycosidase family protein [Bacteroidota bacterium]
MKYFILLLTAFICFNVTAQPNYINISTTDVGPGVVHKKYLEPVQPWTLNVLEIDLTNPMITLESIIANDNIKGSGTVRTQLNSKIREGHTAIGAINGDFYSATPINSQVINGELIKQEDAGHYWATFNLDINNNPAITTNRFSSFVIAGGSKFEIKGINQARNSNWMVLYNSYYGTSTSTGTGVKELVISPTDEWLVNDTMKFVVESIGSGNAVLNKNKAVLSGEGSASDFITQNIHFGDTISLYMGLTNALPKLKQLIGGFPRIVKDGGNYAIDGYREEGGTSTFHTDIHPRSAIGFSADSTKLFFVTIDGRQASSRGMNLIELADFMIYIGVEHGMNLDGGGSTTLIVRDDVENSPSDGSERRVHNSLGVFTSAPKGSLASIQIEPDNFRLFKKDNLKFKTVGYDEYYNPISINNS